ncbi:RNA dependent RNA polymerase-domain-containing protein [Epithele typhae]|uniref:RNA dependent RNA polymerase-domain-containing protein n=1 Tax=Epithele typhae TaxID=378194 RepID=UPI0020085792|nr:RNA dependent RNA polymerase-domain-containing protein [Epithele typhae]KAH9916727.1 RNA dependent RNA polymerase-domain-containing protein [Epithele typhae]
MYPVIVRLHVLGYRSGMLKRITPKRKREQDEDGSPLSRRTSPQKPSSDDTPVLDPVCVAYVHRFTTNSIGCLPWGAQWELAWWTSNGFGSLENNLPVSEFNNIARMSNDAGASAMRKLLSERTEKTDGMYAREQYSKRLAWAELDREELLLKDTESHPSVGGVHSDDGYGGKVNFLAKVTKIPQSCPPRFRLTLERAELGPSNRFTRRFGSRHFIRVRLTKEALAHKGPSLFDFFLRHFVIWTSVYRAFFTKEHNVFLVRTNEVPQAISKDRVVISQDTTDTRLMSFSDFIDWFNRLEENKEQTMAKWAARFALGLSTSIPGIRLEHENIHHIEDILCEGYDGPGKPPSEVQMTDGCGLMNQTAMHLLYERVGARLWTRAPTAVQVRIGGAKGLLLVRYDLPTEDEAAPKIWLRPSQVKINNARESARDPSWLTIDVLRAARMRTPAKLSAETIVNLGENGVPFSCFQELFRADIAERVDALLEFPTGADPPQTPPSTVRATDPRADAQWVLRLLKAVERSGGVMQARAARADSGRARVAGHVYDDRDDGYEDEDDVDEPAAPIREGSSAWWEDPVSGCPSSLEETCMVLLHAGFEPRTCEVLAEKLRQVALKEVQVFKMRYRFAVPMSCSAFMVPDPLGVLEAGEIQIRSSECNLPDPRGVLQQCVVGEVLVTRHPCKVPSDVQRVRAVLHDKLSHYLDVIVVSVKSAVYEGESLKRHLASLCGGGDYDGDTLEVFWDPVIVQNFKVPDPRKFGVVPPEVHSSLFKNTMSAGDFLDKTASVAPNGDKYIQDLQRHLLASLKARPLTGMYSSWWENSAYMNGYDHPTTIFLAYMFCAILDGSKTGVTVKHNKHTIYSKELYAISAPPPYKRFDFDPEDRGTNLRPSERGKGLPEFIMKTLERLTDAECAAMKDRIKLKFARPKLLQPDPHLCAPHADAVRRGAALARIGVPGLRDELARIEEHVRACRLKAEEERGRLVEREERRRAEKGNKGPRGRDKKENLFSSLPIEVRQDFFRAQSRRFHLDGPKELLFFSDLEAGRVMASYAYIHDHEVSGKYWTRFPWDVAMRDLCEIKAHAVGGPRMVSEAVYPWLTISGVALKD